MSLLVICLEENVFLKISALKVFGVFLVLIFTRSLSVFSINAGKYGSEKLRIRTLFKQWF